LTGTKTIAEKQDTTANKQIILGNNITQSS